MGLNQVDVSLRLGAIATILLLAWLLFRRRREVGVPAVVFAPMALCLAGFLIGNTPEPELRLSGAPGAIASFASGSTVAFLWWFCLTCFDKQFRPRGATLAVGLVWIALAAADRLTELQSLSWILVALGFGIVAHLIARLWVERAGDLIQRRHDARLMVSVLLGGQLLVDLSADLVFGMEWQSRWFALAQNCAILVFALWLAGRLLGVRLGVLSFEEADCSRADPVADARVDDGTMNSALGQRLRALIEEQRVHLDPHLEFSDFVARMNAPEKAVRKFVNHELGFDHFRSFLNHHRVAEACRLLGDPARSSEKMIGIAFDSGFASLPSFNRVFRATTGSTPGQYREAVLAKSAKNSPRFAPALGFEERLAVF